MSLLCEFSESIHYFKYIVVCSMFILLLLTVIKQRSRFKIILNALLDPGVIA